MSMKKSFVRRMARDHAALRSAVLRKFCRDEDGSIIILTLLLLIVMLVLGGMAVDFMRFESRRTLLQSVSDRAVLAAAKLEQSLDSEEVVIDYFTKAGFEEAIIGRPTVTEVNGRRSVSVDARLDVDTFYLEFIGIDTLSAPASSAAVEGVGSVEISLVLDISGSMETSFTVDAGVTVPAICADLIDNVATSKTQIQALREGAACFVRQVISPDTEGQVTMSLVPYSEHVNIGPAIFNQLSVQTKSGNDVNDIDPDPITGVAVDASGARIPTCVEIPDADFSTTAFDDSATFEQVQSIQRNTWGRGGFTNNGIDVPSTRDWRQWDLDQPLCPDETYERIIPVSDNEDELEDAILALEPRGGTAIFQGLKWGVTLLDPSFASTLDNISNTGVLPGGAPLAAYEDSRPVAYPEDDPTVNSAKYIVLMTDGKNSDNSRVESEDYETYVSEFNTYNHPFMLYCAAGYMNSGNGASTEAINKCNALRTDPDFDPDFYDNGNGVVDGSSSADGVQFSTKYTAAQGNTLLRNLCTAAKDRNMIIFTIALNADTDGETEMKNCASRVDSELYYYEATGNNLSSIFTTIANQITALRLNL